MNFLRGNFGGGGTEDEAQPKGDQDGNVRDHATFFSWKNIWTDSSEEKAGSAPSAARKGRRSSRSSTGLSVIDETAGNGEHTSSRRSSRDFLGRIGNSDRADDYRDDSDTLEADDDRGSDSSSETLRRGSITDGIKRVVSKTHVTPSDGKADGSSQGGYFNIPWKDKNMSFPWKKDEAGEQGKPSQLAKGGNVQKPSDIGGLTAQTEEDKSKSKSRSPLRHFPWQSSDTGDSDSTSELSFNMPWKSSSDASKKGTGSQDSALHFPWWSGSSSSDDRKERDPSVTSIGETSEDIDSGIMGDESASLISEKKPEKSKQKEKENTNPFQNVPWFVGVGSGEKKAEKNKETHGALPNFPWSREGTDKKNGVGDPWSAAVNLPWLRKSGEKKKTEKGKLEGEKQDQLEELEDSEDAERRPEEAGHADETDEDDIKRPSVVTRVRKVIDSKTDIKIDSMKPLIKSSRYEDSESREKIVDSDGDAKGSTDPSPAMYLEQLVGWKTRAGRVKEKILQNLGKADKTTDDIFDEFEGNFSKQQQNANRLHKEVANYLRCCRALHGASKSLFETLGDVYEPEWVGHELLYAQAQNSDMLWTDFCHKVQDQTLAPLTAYQSQFPEIRKKIDKRGRKLVDYDSQRHQLENLQRATRRDEYKIARAQDALETARVTYEALNKELYDELPSLYDQRIPNVSNHVQSLFAAEATFMAESSKVAKELEAISDKLSKECAKGTYKSKQRAAPRPLSVVEVNKPSSPSIWRNTEWYVDRCDHRRTPTRCAIPCACNLQVHT